MKDPKGTLEQPLYLIPTWTRRIVQIDRPKPEDFDIEDIAHALPMICRWGGQGIWVSVAAHSLAMANHAIKHGSPFALEMLLHDAAEAYLGDQIGPLRRYLTDLFDRRRRQALGVDSFLTTVLDELEYVHEQFNLKIGERFKLPQDVDSVGKIAFCHRSEVKHLDELAMHAEIYMGLGLAVWDMPPATPELAEMHEHLQQAMEWEDAGSLMGRQRIAKEFIRLFRLLER